MFLYHRGNINWRGTLERASAIAGENVGDFQFLDFCN